MNTRLNQFPLPLPDEHILSTLVRWHAVQYYDNFYKSCKDISNNFYNLSPDSVWRRIFNDILSILPSSFGLAKFLKHTHFNYYAAFQPHNFLQVAIFDNYETERKTIPKFQKFIKGNKVWRWCHACAEEDERKYGTSYWHCSHQIPTVTHCETHNIELIGTCENCKFSIRDLASGLLPKGSRCMSCEGCLINLPKTNCSVKKWICEISAHLQKSNGESKLGPIKEALKDNFEDFLESNKISTARRNHPSKIQNAFVKSILTEDLTSEFFSKDFSIAKSWLQFNVRSVIFEEENYPPLYYLLLLKALIKDRAKIHRILGID